MNTKVAIFSLLAFFPQYTDFKAEKSIMQQTTEFILIKQDKNINVYAKWIRVDEKRSARQLKAEFTVNASFAKIIGLIKDDKTTTQWMKNTKSYYIIKTVDLNNWFAYVEFSVPWPFSNQDIIIKYELPTPNAFSQTEIRFTGVPDYLQKNKGVTRISHLEGTWRLMYLDKNLTKIEYVMFSKQAPAFPRWITDPIILHNLLSTMDAFRELVNKN
jgi:hypothetical protein